MPDDRMTAIDVLNIEAEVFSEVLGPMSPDGERAWKEEQIERWRDKIEAELVPLGPDGVRRNAYKVAWSKFYRLRTVAAVS